MFRGGGLSKAVKHLAAEAVAAKPFAVTSTTRTRMATPSNSSNWSSRRRVAGTLSPPVSEVDIFSFSSFLLK